MKGLGSGTHELQIREAAQQPSDQQIRFCTASDTLQGVLPDLGVSEYLLFNSPHNSTHFPDWPKHTVCTWAGQHHISGISSLEKD